MGPNLFQILKHAKGLYRTILFHRFPEAHSTVLILYILRLGKEKKKKKKKKKPNVSFPLKKTKTKNQNLAMKLQCLQ